MITHEEAARSRDSATSWHTGSGIDRRKVTTVRRTLRASSDDRLEFMAMVRRDPAPARRRRLIRRIACAAGLPFLPAAEHLPKETGGSSSPSDAEIEAEAAIRRQRTGSQVLGASAVRGQHPFDRPAKSKKLPAPLFHAASKVVRRELYEMYGWFVAAFREASEKLRAGNRMVSFPAGSFPPALPFVAA